MKRILSTALTLFSALLLLILNEGCKKDGQVAVICTDVSHFETDLGIINISQKSLGNVLLIDTGIKRVFSLGTLNIPAAKIKSSTRRDSMVMLSATKFKFELSGDIAKADAKIKAEVSTQIDNQTTFFLSNFVRKNIEDVTSYLNLANASYPEKYSEPLAANKNTLIAVVTSMTYADKFEFRLKKDADVKAKANTLTVGKYELNVNYSCQNSLDINAHQDGVFYKITLYLFDSNKFTLLSKDIDITDYKMAENALQ